MSKLIKTFRRHYAYGRMLPQFGRLYSPLLTTLENRINLVTHCIYGDMKYGLDADQLIHFSTFPENEDENALWEKVFEGFFNEYKTGLFETAGYKNMVKEFKIFVSDLKEGHVHRTEAIAFDIWVNFRVYEPYVNYDINTIYASVEHKFIEYNMEYNGPVMF